MNFDDPEDRSVIAGEYVLGTLQASERAAVEAALTGHPALHAEVYAWQDRLAPLARRVTPMQPDAGAWLAIEGAVLRQGLQPAAADDPNIRARQAVRGVAAAANDALWHRLRRWQWLGAAALAASLVLATLLGRQVLAPPTAPEQYLAVLQSPDRGNGWLVQATRGGRVRLLPVAATAAAPAGKAYQFWTKAEDAAAPTSLGLVDPQAVTDLPASVLPTLGERQLFELTLEPATGSPTGRPTGPVLFVGRSVRL